MAGVHNSSSSDSSNESVISNSLSSGLRIGELPPKLVFLDLNGKSVNLFDFKDKQALLLFWNPTCGFCTRMLDDLKDWEAKSHDDFPQLLVVSTGSVEQNRLMGLYSTILLDQNFEAGQIFGASGTPSAILLTAEGKIASELAVGASEVLRLFNMVSASTLSSQSIGEKLTKIMMRRGN